MEDKNPELREIKEIHGLTQEEIARLLNVSVATVASWFRRNTQVQRRCSDNMLELLEIKLNLRNMKKE